MSRKNIFENVEIIGSEYPINEGIGIGFIGAIGSLIGLTILGCRIITTIGKHNQQKIINSINNLEKYDSDIRKFKNYIKTIKPIKHTDLIKLMSKSNKGLDDIKYTNCPCCIIESVDDNIIAYAVYDETVNKYGYNIIDNKFKNDKKISNYIKALFELRFGVISDGIKYFNKNMPKIVYLDRDKDYSNKLEIDSYDYRSIIYELRNLGKRLKNEFENNSDYILNEYKYDKAYELSIMDANYPDRDKYDEYEDWHDAVEKYWNDDFKKVINNINNKIKNVLESLEFNVRIQDLNLIATNNNDKYKYINVESSHNYGDILEVEITVELNKHVKVI